MSNLTGHKDITRQALLELKFDLSSNKITRNLYRVGTAITGSVMDRDILDVINGGHWDNLGQKHHFMRKFDGQNQLEAYLDSVNWIKANALDASNLLAKRLKVYSDKADMLYQCASFRNSHSTSISGVLRGKKHYHLFLTDMPNWRPLGNALHALQDSFSEGHVERSPHSSLTKAGTIDRIKMYYGKDKVDHSAHDRKWRNGDGFSPAGRLAINASKDLIKLVFSNARTSPTISLLGWVNFQKKWIAPSEKLTTIKEESKQDIRKKQYYIHIKQIQEFNSGTFPY